MIGYGQFTQTCHYRMYTESFELFDTYSPITDNPLQPFPVYQVDQVSNKSPLEFSCETSTFDPKFLQFPTFLVPRIDNFPCNNCSISCDCCVFFKLFTRIEKWFSVPKITFSYHIHTRCRIEKTSHHKVPIFYGN